MLNPPSLTMSYLKDKYNIKFSKCLNKAGVVALGEELSTDGKCTTAVINYLPENYAKEGEALIDRRYKDTGANNYLSDFYNSEDRVID